MSPWSRGDRWFICGVGVLQKREGVRERLRGTRDSNASNKETKGETRER